MVCTQIKIVKVTQFDQNLIDVDGGSSAVQVKGTVASGPLRVHLVLHISQFSVD